MKPGDKIRHKLTDQYMTIVRIEGTVAVCRLEVADIYIEFGHPVEQWKALCALENLEVIEQENERQMKLF